ncbi:hypothetical protein K8I61_14855 [bacterium]|nr:hypothetical protein [bacterium]
MPVRADRALSLTALTFVVAFAFAGPAHALDTEIGYGGHAAIHVGAFFVDSSGINDYLAPAGADEFNDSALTFGGEIYGVIFERLILGGAGAVSRQEVGGDRMDASLTTSTFTLDFGFLLWDLKGFRGYPVIGFGYAGTLLDVEGDYVDLPFAEQAGLSYIPMGDAGDGTIRLATDESVNLTYGSFALKAAFHFDYVYPFARGDHGGFAFFLTGLRAGVLVDAISTGWLIDGGEDLNGDEPDFRNNIGFVRLAFGFGGGVSDADVKKNWDRHERMWHRHHPYGPYHHHPYPGPPPEEPEDAEPEKKTEPAPPAEPASPPADEGDDEPAPRSDEGNAGGEPRD